MYLLVPIFSRVALLALCRSYGVKKTWKLWANSSSTNQSKRRQIVHRVHIMWDLLFLQVQNWHDDVLKWKHFPRYWPFVRGIHRSPVNSSRKGQWRGALIFSLIRVWINGWVNNREAGDLRCDHAHYDVSVMSKVKVCAVDISRFI